MFIQGTCDVCDRERQIGVASLPFAPCSVAFCHECLTEHAYPLWSLHATIELCGGPEQVADWFKECRSFKDGIYIGWDAILACYKPADNKEIDE